MFKGWKDANNLQIGTKLHIIRIKYHSEHIADTVNGKNRWQEEKPEKTYTLTHTHLEVNIKEKETEEFPLEFTLHVAFERNEERTRRNECEAL